MADLLNAALAAVSDDLGVCCWRCTLEVGVQVSELVSCQQRLFVLAEAFASPKNASVGHCLDGEDIVDGDDDAGWIVDFAVNTTVWVYPSEY